MKLLILDRDGVINEDSDSFIKTPDEWIPLPGSLEAIARLTKAGYTIVVATNQSGLGRGFFDITTLNAIHQKMQAAVKAVAEALGDTGRILVRESGTEPLVRVMVEAPDHDTCQKYVSQVVEVIKGKGYAV